MVTYMSSEHSKFPVFYLLYISSPVLQDVSKCPLCLYVDIIPSVCKIIYEDATLAFLANMEICNTISKFKNNKENKTSRYFQTMLSSVKD